jgi:hypothetical protein
VKIQGLVCFYSFIGYFKPSCGKMSAMEAGEVIIEEKEDKENQDIQSKEENAPNEELDKGSTENVNSVVKESENQPPEQDNTDGKVEQSEEKKDEVNDQLNGEKGEENIAQLDPNQTPDSKQDGDQIQTELLPKTDETTEHLETSVQTEGRITPDKASEEASQEKEDASVSEPTLVAPPASKIDLHLTTTTVNDIKKSAESQDVKGEFTRYLFV